MTNTLPGKFITLEGGEGVGKSTNLELLKTMLHEKGIPFVATREPGGTPIAEEIRRILVTKQSEQLQPISELLLMFAGRAQHLHEVIIPALEKGQWVLCDRFTDATYAYQGGGRGLAKEKIATLEQWVQGTLQPDLTFLLDLPVTVGLERAANRGDKDRFEQEKMVFFEAVRKVYLERMAADPNRFVRINADQTLERVHAELREKFLAYIESVGYEDRP